MNRSSTKSKGLTHSHVYQAMEGIFDKVNFHTYHQFKVDLKHSTDKQNCASHALSGGGLVSNPEH